MYWVTIAIAPAIALVWFFYVRGAYRPVRKSLIALLFLSGGAAALLALTLNHLVEKYTLLWPGAPEQLHRILFWFFGVGLNEEFAKMVPLLLLFYPRRHFKTPYQGLLAAVSVALGFAALENLFYLERYGSLTVLTRSVLTVPAHAFFTAPLGVMMAYSRQASGVLGKYLWLLGGLSVATALHGLYDVWLSLDSEWLEWIAYLQVVLMGLLVLKLMRLRPTTVSKEPA
ncbi:MAG: PrsW family glutamic-type intramembrane protease [SAR324 cluster bacterium]|nr:PrsW family glutamic-type intramembrane protease [SAR324 cluster bacterium]